MHITVFLKPDSGSAAGTVLQKAMKCGRDMFNFESMFVLKILPKSGETRLLHTPKPPPKGRPEGPCL